MPLWVIGNKLGVRSEKLGVRSYLSKTIGTVFEM